MLIESTLRNIFKYEFLDLFKSYQVINYENRTKSTDRNDYKPIMKVIKEELTNPKSKFTAQILDDILFEQLFYLKNNYQYVYRFDQLFCKENTQIASVIEKLKNIHGIELNNSLTNAIEEKKYKLLYLLITSEPLRLLKLEPAIFQIN